MGGTTPHAAGHHEQMALVAHAPNTYTQAQGVAPQEPERRGHTTRQYIVKVSLLTSEAPHPVHTAPVARVGTRRVQDDTGRERRRMASGDAQKVWFPELIAMVRQAGDAAMSMEALLCLRDRLNTTLHTIRHTRQILPAMMWCPHCQARHRAAPPSVSVRATILALGRYTRATASEVQTLEKQWNRYRKQHQLDRDGQPEVAGAVPHQRPRVTR